MSELRYHRSDAVEVNKLLTYILGLTPGIELTYSDVFDGYWGDYYSLGIRVFIRDKFGKETEITPGSPVAIVTDQFIISGGYEKIGTWIQPKITLATTDSIVVRFYISTTATPEWTLFHNDYYNEPQTEQLGVTSLPKRIWKVYYRYYISVVELPPAPPVYFVQLTFGAVGETRIDMIIPVVARAVGNGLTWVIG